MPTWLSLNAHVMWAVAGMFAALAAGTAIRLRALFGRTRRAANEQLAKQRLASLASWWAAAVVLAAAALLGRAGAVILFAAVSIVGFSEFLKLARLAIVHRHGTATGSTNRVTVAGGLVRVSFVLIGLNYVWILLDLPGVHLRFLPLAGLALVAIFRVIGGRTEGFVSIVSGVFWGLMLVAYCLSHAALLFTLPDDGLGPAGAGGLLIYLVVLTEFNDIAQAHVGRRFGKRKITPTVSPNKTWGGFLGGIVATVLLAILLAPLLTPLHAAESSFNNASIAALPYLCSGLIGLLIALAGFLGDIVISAVKRDAGVKDSGTIVPGHGGMLDRIDSLLITAPLFFYLVVAMFV